MNNSKIADKQPVIEMLATDKTKPHPDNPRKHSKKQIRQIAESIKAFGFKVPVIVDEADRLIAGHGRIAAARLLKLESVPAIRISDLDDAQKRAFMIADNQLTENADWDEQLLGRNLKILSDLDLDFDLEVTGLSTGTIDTLISGFEILGEVDEADGDDSQSIEDDKAGVLTSPSTPISRHGDLWLLGEHRVLCADATLADSYSRLLDQKKAQMVITDPPYNISATTIGKTAQDHGDFVQAAGEMSQTEFDVFLRKVFALLAANSSAGSIHYVFMDWRHAQEILNAGADKYSKLKNLCVWAKDNAGMGSFYRSRHELVFVFKSGKGRHINNFELGQHGRMRSNVWEYAGISGGRPEAVAEDRTSEHTLRLHPTVKPVKLIADAILDCSKRGGLILDPFLGSGTTLMAAERTGRVCRGMELDPRYADTIIRRWQDYTGEAGVHAQTGVVFSDVAAERLESREVLAPQKAPHDANIS